MMTCTDQAGMGLGYLSSRLVDPLLLLTSCSRRGATSYELSTLILTGLLSASWAKAST